MTNHWSGPEHAGQREASHARGPVPPAQRDAATLCDSYAPGHQLHYRHQGRAAGSPAVGVCELVLVGSVLNLRLDDGRELEWRNHDPVRLSRIQDLVPDRGTVHPLHHALRLGPYWFNCATGDDPWEDCRLSLPR